MAKTDKEILCAVLESMGEPAAIRGYVIAAVEEAIRMTREDADDYEEDLEDEEEEDDLSECADCGVTLTPEGIVLCVECDIELCTNCVRPPDGPICEDCAVQLEEEEYEEEDEELVIGNNELKDQAI